MLETKTYTGTIKWFNQEKGFDFIKADSSISDVFVHKNVNQILPKLTCAFFLHSPKCGCGCIRNVFHAIDMDLPTLFHNGLQPPTFVHRYNFATTTHVLLMRHQFVSNH